MPTYQFQCDPDKGGCGEVQEVFCLYSQLADHKPKSCPTCRKRKALVQMLGQPIVSIPQTLGSRVDKNSDKMSADEKHHLTKKHNAYKEPSGDGPSWIPTENGMVHKDSLKAKGKL